MDIPLSRFQCLSFEQIKDSCKFPFLHSNFKRFQESSLISRKLKTPFFQISCSYVEQGLKPRPVPKPSKIELDGEKVEDFDKPRKGSSSSSSSSSLAGQIEKLVVYKRFKEALELFEILECEGDHEVGGSTYDALVNACIGSRSIRGVKRVFSFMIKSGFEPDQYLRNRMLLMHVKCKMMIDARYLFDEMPERNLVSWNTIIGGLVDSGDYVEAFRLFITMWEEYSGLGVGCRSFSTMIRAASGLEVIYPGRQLHSITVKMGIAEDVFLSCALIDMYSKCGSIDDAQCVFDLMPTKTTVGWNSIISGYALHGYSEEALTLYYEMLDSGVKMDHFTFSIIIRICARLGSLEHAKQAHAGLVRNGFGLDMVANSALVDFYSKWGRIEDARNVFEKMPLKNVISWNALIAGYGNHGRGMEAVRLFHRMNFEGVMPNHVTFLAVLSACSYSNLQDYGWEIFESMSRDHKVKPRAMHYACMIELLGREGHLDEAFAFISDCPFKPTVNMWAALLTACRVNKNLVLGKLAAEKIYGMEPEKLSNYVVLLNVYNSLGKSEEAASVFNTLRKKGLRMLPACTWIEIKKQSYVFYSGDKSHAQAKEIYENLDKLMLKISKHGYAPENNTLLPDVDKQEGRLQSYHSEKLAISFGLLNSQESTPLHLVQSHRICNDCHNAVKLIAMVTNCEIVVRDASRFHRFQDGKCSCGDYW